jgi:hypothetical protein
MLNKSEKINGKREHQSKQCGDRFIAGRWLHNVTAYASHLQTYQKHLKVFVTGTWNILLCLWSTDKSTLRIREGRPAGLTSCVYTITDPYSQHRYRTKLHTYSVSRVPFILSPPTNMRYREQNLTYSARSWFDANISAFRQQLPTIIPWLFCCFCWNIR